MKRVGTTFWGKTLRSQSLSNSLNINARPTLFCSTRNVIPFQSSYVVTIYWFF